MPDFNDNELDKLFQEAADQIRPEFDIRDWEQLSARLDQQDDKGIFYRSISLYSIAILLFFLTVRATWKELYPSELTSGIVTTSVKEEPFKNSSAINGKYINTDSSGSLQNNIVKTENNHKEAVKTESKSNTVDFKSSQKSNRLNKTEDIKDLQLGESNDNNTVLHLKRSGSHTETSNKINEDLQKDGSHNTIATNQSTADVDALGNTDKHYSNVTHDNSDDLNSDWKSGALYVDKQSTDVTNSEVELQKDDDIQIRYLSINKEADSLKVLRSGNVIVKDDNNQTSDLNEGKKVNVSDFEASNQGVDGLNSDKMIGKDVGKQTSDLNRNKKVTSSDFETNNQSINVLNYGKMIEKNDGKQTSNLNSNEKIDSLDLDTNKQIIHFANTELATTKDDGRQTHDLKKDKEVDSLNSNKRNDHTTESKIVSYGNNSKQIPDLNKSKAVDSLNINMENLHTRYYIPAVKNGDSTRINDSTKILENKHTQLIDNPTEDSSEVKTELAKTRSLFVKLPISPDFTSVKNQSIGGPGINAGLLIEYSISKHIAFETGAIWSKKLYDARYSQVNFVEGHCRILDIPINIKYYLIPDSRTNFFATVGFSSYVMLKEKYDYTVITPNNGERRWSQEYSRKNNEWFSILNFSIGAQRQVSKRLWLQAEPFFKAPIAGVGAVKIKLVSMGAFLTLKYKLR